MKSAEATVEIPIDLFHLVNLSAEAMGVKLGTWMLIAFDRMLTEEGWEE